MSASTLTPCQLRAWKTLMGQPGYNNGRNQGDFGMLLSEQPPREFYSFIQVVLGGIAGDGHSQRDILAELGTIKDLSSKCRLRIEVLYQFSPDNLGNWLFKDEQLDSWLIEELNNMELNGFIELISVIYSQFSIAIPVLIKLSQDQRLSWSNHRVIAVMFFKARSDERNKHKDTTLLSLRDIARYTLQCLEERHRNPHKE